RFIGRHLVETLFIVREKSEKRIVQAPHVVLALEYVEQSRIEFEVTTTTQSAPLFLALELYGSEDHGGFGVASAIGRVPAGEPEGDEHRLEATLLEVLLSLALNFDHATRGTELLRREL